MNKKFKGDLGEFIARCFLSLKGYEILEKNYRVKGGEIDIIAKKNNTLVIAEVKTRKNNKFSDPKDAVDYYKKKHIIYATRIYLHRSNTECDVRFDVIEVMPFKINHIKDAFTGDGF